MPKRAATMDAMDLDRLFQALSDVTRRGVVERLGTGPASVSDLAAPFDMALPSFTEHLRVLERAGLVSSTKHGRVRTYQLAPQRLADADDWLQRQRALWERRLDQFDSYLTTLESEKGHES